MSSFNFYEQSSPELIDWVGNHSILCPFSSGDILIQEGKEIDSIFILKSGTLTVSTTDLSKSQVSLAEVQKGAIIGEMSWLEGRLPVATIAAKTDIQVLQISRETLDQLSSNNINLAAELMLLIARKLSLQISSQNEWVFRFERSSKLVESIRKVLILFSCLDESDVYKLAEIGELQRFTDGDAVIKQGDNLSCLYLVLAGDLDVFINLEGHSKLIGSSRRGEILGELSYLATDNFSASASVVCRGGVELLRLGNTKLRKYIDEDAYFACRLYKGISCMLSQRSRDQLYENNLSILSNISLDDDGDEIDLSTIGGLNRAGQRFSWLCDKFQLATGF